MTYLKPLAAAFCAALTVASAPLFGQTAIPNTPAGRVLRAWVDAYNSGDSARVAMFFRTYSVEDALRGAFAFRKMTGGLDLLSVQVSEPRHVEFMTRFRLRPMVGYGALDVSAADTSRVSGYLFPLGMNVSVDDIRIDAPTRERVVGRLAALLDSFYVSPEVGKRMSDSLHARLKRGVYDRYTNGATFAIHLRADLDDIAHDKHLQILYSLLPRGPEPQPDTVTRHRREREAHCPVWATGRLEGNVPGTYGSTGLSIRESAGRPLSRRSPPWPKRKRSSLTCEKTRAAVKPAQLLSSSRTCLTAVLISVTCGSVIPATHGSAGRWTPLPVRASAGRSLSMCLLPRIRFRQVRNWRTTCRRSSGPRSWARRRPAKPMRHLKPALKTTLASCCPPERRSTL